MGAAVCGATAMARELPIDVGASAAGTKLRRELRFGKILKVSNDSSQDLDPTGCYSLGLTMQSS